MVESDPDWSGQNHYQCLVASVRDEYLKSAGGILTLHAPSAFLALTFMSLVISSYVLGMNGQFVSVTNAALVVDCKPLR